MPGVSIFINSRRPFGRNWGGKRGMKELIRFLQAAESGAIQCDTVTYGSNDTVALGDQAYPSQACAVLIGSALTGAVGATIDGTLVTATAAGGDVATQTLVAAVINANASVTRKVGAANRVAQMTLASVLVGTRVRVFGTEFVAVNGAPTDFGQFDMSGADAADATSLALAINRHPSLVGRCRAVANGAVVYVGLLEQRVANDWERLGPASATTITINVAIPVASAVCLVFSSVCGQAGECCTIAASGTGMTVATANAGKLGSGTGGHVVMQYITP